MQFYWRISFLLAMFLLIIIAIAFLHSQYVAWESMLEEYSQLPTHQLYESPSAFNGFDNESGAPNGQLIIPDIVHFLRYGKGPITFIEAICMLAALKHQQPLKMYLHTDQKEPFAGGRYWTFVKDHPLAIGKVRVRYLDQYIINDDTDSDTEITFTRIHILMKYGGFVLDSNCYIVRSLDFLRKYEIVLSWPDGGSAGGELNKQIIISHPNARWLRMWQNIYEERKAYRYEDLNSKTVEILTRRPELVHRMRYLLGEKIHLNDKGAKTPWHQCYAVFLPTDQIHNSASSNVNFTDDEELQLLCSNADIRNMVLEVFKFEEPLNCEAYRSR